MTAGTSARTKPEEATRRAAPPHFRVAIVGTGFAGLGAAIQLAKAGIDDYVLLERADDVGGTWRDNTYPGCACDVPSQLYSFSFALNPDWTRSFSPQPEIWDYLRRVAKDYDIPSRTWFAAEMQAAEWDDTHQRWRIETAGGPLTADVLVSGMGFLSDPSVPSLPGLESFRGTTFHSATWDHDHDLTGERVAVVGTGASAIQFVPEIAPRVGTLHLFQRTAPWVTPRTDRRVTSVERAVYRRFPAVQRLVRGLIYWGRECLVVGFTVRPRLMKVLEKGARRHLERQVPDPELRAKLTPDYTLGCKRILLSNTYLPALCRPNVEVVTAGIREVREHSIVTDDGTERAVDTIVFGTGFRVTDAPLATRIRGRNGQLLVDAWADGAQAYRGTTVTGFPNFFMIVGPNTGLGHSSMVYMIESQLNYLVDCLRYMSDSDTATVEVRDQPQTTFNRRVQRRMKQTVWSTGGCSSWYLDKQGLNTTLWPWATWNFRRLTRRFDADAYVVRPRENDPARAA